MVKKKRVPDWLNSPMWASPTVTTSPPSKSRSLSPPPNHHDRTGKTSSVTSSDSSVNESRFMLPPAASIRPESIQRTEVRDSSTRRGSSDYDNDSSGSVVEDVSRQAQLLQELSKKIINLGELRQLASLGIPDAAGIRSTTWKLLLGYLPIDKRMWSSELSKKRSQYKHFKEDLLMNPDSEIIEQIDRDVKRTHPDIPFFSGDSAFAKANQDSLKNILIIFAKLNPGIRYVQGMNEILAPLFYVFKTDPNEDYAVNAEADTFFCFVELLSDFRDNFCQQLDNSIVGIRSTISRLSQLLKQHDEELWRHLEVTTKVNPQFYAFRWITLLLTQEFNFTDILHIWDMLLSNPVGPRETLLRICCAMLILVRRRLLAGDFTANLKLLQSYPSTNVSHLLYVANKLNSQSAH
ncbi:TBC1 domain family member 13 isoform X2 [Helianthus annuus]|uniref:TBC1 domain family member 13 isoform X2 n=1 Tax=Helianthus annuus TaxID=4232 RepID=UPI000B8F37BC|nr:TBC1 domain family member 13 isoform X2 [Helianthus annuus]